VGWVFFRATTLADSLFVLQQMFSTRRLGLGWALAWWHFWLTIGSLFLAMWEEKRGWFEAVARGPAWSYSAAVFVMLACLELFGVTDLTIPFVYFQF